MINALKAHPKRILCETCSIVHEITWAAIYTNIQSELSVFSCTGRLIQHRQCPIRRLEVSWFRNQKFTCIYSTPVSLYPALLLMLLKSENVARLANAAAAQTPASSPHPSTWDLIFLSRQGSEWHGALLNPATTKSASLLFARLVSFEVARQDYVHAYILRYWPLNSSLQHSRQNNRSWLRPCIPTLVFFLFNHLWKKNRSSKSKLFEGWS